MKTKWMTRVTMAGLLLAGVMMTSPSLLAESHWSVGIGIGTPGYYAPPPPVVVYRPPIPGPGYYWVDGYYDPYGAWTAGYWAPPRYYRPYYGYGYVAPRFYGGYYRRDFDRDDFRRGRGWERGRGWGRR